jgi:hypothetical protein
MKKFRDLNRLQKTGLVAAQAGIGFLAIVNCGGSSGGTAEQMPACNSISIKPLGEYAIKVRADVNPKGANVDYVAYDDGDHAEPDHENIGNWSRTFSVNAAGDLTIRATVYIEGGDGPVPAVQGDPTHDKCSAIITFPLNPSKG